MPTYILDALSAHLARTGRRDPAALVLQSPAGGPVRATNFRLRVYGPALQRAELPGLSFHRLRHSAGHMMREAGVPLDWCRCGAGAREQQVGRELKKQEVPVTRDFAEWR
ncbi:MAG: hypothetical protein ACYCZV_07735 [Acidimicrobiales bacterium]